MGSKLSKNISRSVYKISRFLSQNGFKEESNYLNLIVKSAAKPTPAQMAGEAVGLEGQGVQATKSKYPINKIGVMDFSDETIAAIKEFGINWKSFKRTVEGMFKRPIMQKGYNFMHRMNMLSLVRGEFGGDKDIAQERIENIGSEENEVNIAENLGAILIYMHADPVSVRSYKDAGGATSIGDQKVLSISFEAISGDGSYFSSDSDTMINKVELNNSAYSKAKLSDSIQSLMNQVPRKRR